MDSLLPAASHEVRFLHPVPSALTHGPHRQHASVRARPLWERRGRGKARLQQQQQQQATQGQLDCHLQNNTHLITALHIS